MPLPVAKPRRRRWSRHLGLILLLGFVLLNIVAFMQARAMTRFVATGAPLQGLLERPWYARWWAALTGVQVARPRNSQTPADLKLAYESLRIDMDGAGPVSGRTAQVESLGGAEPGVDSAEHIDGWWVEHQSSRGIVLLLPGYAQPKDSLLAPAAELHAWGYSSLLIDFRGAGESSGNDTTLGFREAQDVAAAVGYLQQRWPDQPVFLYGVSMGATAALRAIALEGVRPAALIVEGPFDRLLTAVRQRFYGMGIPSFPSAELLLFWGSVQMGYNGFEHNPDEYAALIDCPVLIMYGERDPWIHGAEMESIASRLGGPATIVVVPGRGHEMPFSMGAPDLWRAQVGPFLEWALVR